MSLSKPVLPQNDNVAHALAGAGGGILSMVLTYALSPTLPLLSSLYVSLLCLGNDLLV